MLNATRFEQQHKTRLGDLLVKRGVISSAQLKEALAAQTDSSAPLGEILISLGHISERQLKRNLGRQSLLRATALTATILLSPLAATNAFAASQGALGHTSTAKVQITLRIAPRIEVSGLDNVFYDSGKNLVDDFCIRGRGIDGFQLSSSWQHKAQNNTDAKAYQVTYNGKALAEAQSKALSHQCHDSRLAIVPPANLQTGSNVLTLTIAPQ